MSIVLFHMLCCFICLVYVYFIAFLRINCSVVCIRSAIDGRKLPLERFFSSVFLNNNVSSNVFKRFARNLVLHQ